MSKTNIKRILAMFYFFAYITEKLSKPGIKEISYGDKMLWTKLKYAIDKADKKCLILACSRLTPSGNTLMLYNHL